MSDRTEGDYLYIKNKSFKVFLFFELDLFANYADLTK